MSKLLKLLHSKFLCRDFQIERLYNLYGYKDEAFPDCVYLFGCTSTGKSSIMSTLLKIVNINHVIVNLIECYSAKILFEKILNSLVDNSLDCETGQPLFKCDNMMDFISTLRQMSREKDLSQTVIVLDKAERLRDMDMNLFPAFVRFRELSGLNISCVMISELELNKLIPTFDISMPIEIYFPQYTKEQLNEIILHDLISSRFSDEINVKLENEKDFYRNYLNAFLSVFYRVCRDMCELRYLAKKNFSFYCKPVVTSQIHETDVARLWRNFAPILKSSLNEVYLRINSHEDNLIKDGVAQLNTNKKLAQSLELPFYAKYLLIAAYLASYNPAKEDKRLFMKYHGKKTKSKAGMNAKNKVTEQLNTQLGPKPFPFDRLLAIFYAILDDKVGLNSNLLVQVSSLVQLQLLSAVGDGASLDNQKYKCNVGFDFILTVAKMVGFNIRKYIYDFI